MDERIPVDEIKPGVIFEHRHWLDHKNMPLLCRVTLVRHGVVYYADWSPDDKRGRGKYYFDSKDSHKYIKQFL